MAKMGSKKKHNKQEQPPRRPTWLIAAAVAVAAAVAAVVAQRSDPFRDLDDAAVATAAFEALRDAQPKRARAAFAELVTRDADDSFAWSWRGRAEVALSDLDAAETSYTRALETLPRRLFDEDDNERRTMKTRRAQLMLDLERVRGRLEARSAPINSVTYHEMERRHWRDVVPSDEPLILTGFSTVLSLDLITDRCGSKQVRSRRRSPNSTAWAAMNEGEETTISEFIHSQQKDAAVFDWPLQYCPDLLSEIEVPPFAALDHVATAYGPSLFISFSAKGGGPHVDSGSTKFWQHVHAGRKEWSAAGVSELRGAPRRHRRDSSLAGASRPCGTGLGCLPRMTTGDGPSSATRGVLAFLGVCRRNATTGLVRRPWICLMRALSIKRRCGRSGAAPRYRARSSTFP
mmetsp:Transcript_13182/g.38297  ORF Transcript_13182/g.38297 Transcript_13182/m.38297 type:complete len:403 (-) Transcript_13182:272-1480(-)